MRTIILILTAALLGLLSTGCKKADSRSVEAAETHSGEAKHDHAAETAGKDDHEAEGHAEPVHLAGDEQEQVGVVVGKVEATDGKEMTRYPGRLVSMPEGAVRIGPFLAGRVINLPVRLGQTVKAGQVLCFLQSSEGAEKLSTWLRAKSNLALLRKEVARLDALQKDGIGSLRDLEVKKTELEAAEAEHQAAEQTILALGIDPEQPMDHGSGFPLKSPISGSITQMDVSLGQYVSPGADLFRVVNPRLTQVRIDVYEKDAHRVRDGAGALVRLPNTNQSVEAKVRSLGRELSEDSRTFPVLLDLIGLPNETMPGMRADVYLETGAVIPGLLRVPDEALILTESGYRVFAQTGESSFEPREIEIVSLEQNTAMVRGALKSGESIAVKGGFFLQSQAMRSNIVDACAH